MPIFISSWIEEVVDFKFLGSILIPIDQARDEIMVNRNWK